jgi:hypothetical protein
VALLDVLLQLLVEVRLEEGGIPLDDFGEAFLQPPVGFLALKLSERVLLYFLALPALLG